MVMTRSSRTSTKKLKRGSSSRKGVIFYQDGLTMDPIDVEPLISTHMALVPYGLSEEDTLAPVTSEKQSPSHIKESRSNQGPNPEGNFVQTLLETSVSDTKPGGTKENEPFSF